MKQSIFGIFILFSSFSLFADDGISISDVNGNEFLTTFQKISNAYFFHHEPQGFNYQIVNGDASVAIINPVFEYAGKKIPYAGWGSNDHGICKHLGFNRAHGIETYDKHGTFVTAEMEDDGTLSEINHVRSHRSLVITAIVCSHRSLK